MTEYIFFHHDDALNDGTADWDAYFAKLRTGGRFEGGSEIGDGACYRKSGAVPAIAKHIGGYIKVTALAEEACLPCLSA